ncbi:AAA family ATPase [Hyalangium versicolor]|uniref:AAA family ATPase n=1 Tax=Hyalangium versicolor TaxID=2861190 RepID=UPI001CCBAE1F|nr:AAA family ATPase [Hyalangium versicolor]
MNDSSGIQIVELRLAGFRAFENVRLRFDELTVLVGRNGAGKSTLIDALVFLRDALTDSLENALTRREGLSALLHRSSKTAKKLSIALTVRISPAYLRAFTQRTGLVIEPPYIRAGIVATYGFQVTPSRTAKGFRVEHESIRFDTPEGHAGPQPQAPHRYHFFSREGLSLPLLAIGKPSLQLILDALKTSVRAYRLSPEAIRLEPPIGRTSILHRNGDNAGDVLHSIERNRKELSWITRHLAAITPGISRLQSGTAAGRRLIRFFQQSGKSTRVRFDIRDMSDGTLRCLAILLALRQSPSPALVCIEEIEDSVHPAALSVLLDAVDSSTRRCQVLLTSHSPEALSHPSVTPERIRVIQWRNGRSQLFRLSTGAEEMSRPPRSVGKLLRSNALFTADEPERVESDFFTRFFGL